jgi:hypothetical protein
MAMTTVHRSSGHPDLERKHRRGRHVDSDIARR